PEKARVPRDRRSAASRRRQPRRGRGTPGHKPADAALQTGAHAGRWRAAHERLSGVGRQTLTTRLGTMNQISPQQLLQQIRALNAEMQAGAANRPVETGGDSFGVLLKQSLDAVNDTQQAATAMKTGFEN